MDSDRFKGRRQVYSFISYKGCSGRSTCLVQTAHALTTQGANVLIIDLDFDGAGIPVFSSTKKPDPMFQPDHLFPLGRDKPLSESNNSSVPLQGLLTVLGRFNDNVWNVSDNSRTLNLLGDLPLYEARSPYRNALEGRLFLLPMGGRFEKETISRQTADMTDMTPWIYFPLSMENDERKGLINSSRILEGNFPFFRDVLEQAILQAESHFQNVKIDYVLIDERSGIDVSALVGSANADGIVVLASHTRGNLAGIKQIIENISTLKKDVGSKDLMFPPIVGVIISFLAKGVLSGKGGNPLEVYSLVNSLRQTRFVETLNKYRAKKRISPPNQFDFESCVNMQIQCLHPTGRLNKSSLPTEDGNSLWGLVPKEFPDLKPFFDTALPIWHLEGNSIQDRVFGLRGFCKEQSNWPSLEDELGNIASVVLLAGHLRNFNPGDESVKHWKTWFTSNWKKAEGTKLKDWNFKNIDEVPWQSLWYYAQWLEHEFSTVTKSSQVYLENAVEILTRVIEKQNQIAEHVRGWNGDWRILLKRARIYSKLEQTQNAHNDYLATLACISNEPEEDQISLTEFKAEIHRELANYLKGQGKLLEASHHFEKSVNGHPWPSELAYDLVDFYHRFCCDKEISPKEKNKAYDMIEDFIKKSFYRRINIPGLMMNLVRLRMARYWLQMFHESEIKNKIDFLKESQTKIRELVGMRDDGRLVLRDGEIPGMLGEVCLELASLDERLSQRDIYLFEALENLVEATQLEPQSLKLHILLATVRCLDVQRIRSKVETRGGADIDPARTSGKPRQLEIRERDAFYSFEQAAALKQDPDIPKIYFTESQVEDLMKYLPTPLQILAGESLKGLHDYILPPILGWFHMFDRDNDFSVNDANSKRILSERGVI